MFDIVNNGFGDESPEGVLGKDFGKVMGTTIIAGAFVRSGDTGESCLFIGDNSANMKVFTADAGSGALELKKDFGKISDKEIKCFAL